MEPPVEIPVQEEAKTETKKEIRKEQPVKAAPKAKEKIAPKKIDKIPEATKIQEAKPSPKIIERIPEPVQEIPEPPKIKETPRIEPPKKIQEAPRIHPPKKIESPEPIREIPPEPPKLEEKEPIPAPEEPEIAAPKIVEHIQEKKPEKPRIRLTPISAIKSFITSEVEIKEADVKEMLESLELELLESDVDMSVAQGITEDISSRLIGAKIKKGALHPFIASSIKQTLTEVLTNERSFDLLERLDASEKPMKIMFIGINGAGKTTTIAKVAKLMMDGKKKVVFAAADTFRAAAIEQMEVHAGRLGVKTIKRDYGSDPTSVAYDAVGYAKAHGIDAVLIDTAGRQDTNISLLNEIKKMSRVISPDLKIYIGESISGNAIVEQISSFNREVGIDAVILTKMDCDPKGGTMLSISKATGIPIIYVGTGQGYTDLERFDPGKIAERIVG